MHVSPFQRGHYEKVRLKIVLTWSAKKWTLRFSASFKTLKCPCVSPSVILLPFLFTPHPASSSQKRKVFATSGYNWRRAPSMLYQLHFRMKSRRICFPPPFSLLPLCHCENQAPRCNSCWDLHLSAALVSIFSESQRICRKFEFLCWCSIFKKQMLLNI